MKATPYAKLSALFFAGAFFFGAPAFAQSEPLTEARLQKIEKQLAESEAREKEILKNQAEILEKIHSLRYLVRRS